MANPSETLTRPFDANEYVSLGNEEEYCRRNGMEIKRLSNGIVLVGIVRPVNDAFYANINFSFPTGSYLDPSNKPGIHHLLEHMVSDGTIKEVEEHDVGADASTQTATIVVKAGGVANPRVQSYGMWRAIPFLAQALAHPLMGNGDIEALLAKEVAVVGEEIDRYHANPGYHARRTMQSFLFGRDNPLIENGLGTKKGLSRISVSDIKALAERVFVPSGAIVSLFAEGNTEMFEMLMDQLGSVLVDFPRVDRKPFLIDKDLYDQFNPDFAQGNSYTKGTRIKNKQTYVSYTWVMPKEVSPSASFALDRLLPRINQRFFNYMRSLGMVYEASANSSVHSKHTLVSMDFITGKRFKDIERVMQDLYCRVKDEVFGSLRRDRLEWINAREREIQEAVILPAKNRLSLALEGLSEKGLIMDADVIKDFYKHFTTQDLQNWVDRLTSTPPAVFITGDVG